MQLPPDRTHRGANPAPSVPGVPQARGPSIRPPDNRMARDDGPYWREGRSEAPHPRPRGDYPRGGLPRRWAPEFAESARSNGRWSLDSSAGVERSLRSNARCRLRGSQGHGETDPDLERFVTRARAYGVGMLSAAACSWDTSVIRGCHNQRRVWCFQTASGRRSIIGAVDHKRGPPRSTLGKDPDNPSTAR